MSDDELHGAAVPAGPVPAAALLERGDRRRGVADGTAEEAPVVERETVDKVERRERLCSRCDSPKHDVRFCRSKKPDRSMQQVEDRLSARRMKDGLCRQCGREPKVRGGSTCVGCRERMTRAQRKLRRARYEKRVSA